MAPGITCQFAKSRLALPVVFSAAVVTGHLHLRIAGFAICSEKGDRELVRVESTRTDRLIVTLLFVALPITQ